MSNARNIFNVLKNATLIVYDTFRFFPGKKREEAKMMSRL